MQQLIDIGTDNDSSVVNITVSGDSVDISLKGTDINLLRSTMTYCIRS